MKRTKIEANEAGIKSWKNDYPQTCDQSTSIITSSLKYPIGYGRPDQKKVWIRYQQNLKRLPESIANMQRSQEEAARNGLTEEILEKLLTEDAA